MISIQRTECPRVLGGGSRARDRYKKVVDELHSMQHGKCCYCECDLPDEGHGKAVDHFRPKAVYKGLRNDWQNLLLACPHCNGKKGDDFPVEPLTNKLDEVKVLYLERTGASTPLVMDPSDPSVDPEDHLDFHMDLRNRGMLGLICAKNGSRRGKRTIEVIGLYRDYYKKQHREHIIELHKEFLVLLSASGRHVVSEVERCKAWFRIRLSATNKLAAVARAFAREYALDTEFGIEIPVGSEKGTP